MSEDQYGELSQRMRKAAESMETNEDGTNRGVMNVYENPSDRAPGTIDAKWGDRPPPNEAGLPGQYGSAVVRESKDDRHGVLDRIFDSLGPASSAAQSEIRQNFAHGASGDYESHSPLLGRMKTASIEEHAPEGRSLTERVRNLLG